MLSCCSVLFSCADCLVFEVFYVSVFVFWDLFHVIVVFLCLCRRVLMLLFACVCLVCVCFVLCGCIIFVVCFRVC